MRRRAIGQLSTTQAFCAESAKSVSHVIPTQPVTTGNGIFYEREEIITENLTVHESLISMKERGGKKKKITQQRALVILGKSTRVQRILKN